MKKLLVILMVLAFAAPVIPAMADDALDLSGAMRVRAWKVDNSDYTDDDTADLSYWDQRMRIQGVINAADGVKAVFRVDLAEDVWGSANWATHRYNEGSELQVDRAYLDVTKGIVNVKAGQQYMGLGNSYAYDNNQTGLQISLATPLTVRVGYAKIDENSTSTTTYSVDPGPDGILGTADDITVPSTAVGTDRNDDPNTSDDTDHYFIDLGYKTDVFSINAFYAMQTDGDDATQDEPTLMGALASFGVGPVNVVAELDMFGGESGPSGATVDYTGIQFIANASMKFSDQFTGGAVLIYSDGEDDADEEKITRFPNAFFGSMYYSDLGAFHTDIAPLGDGDVFDPADTNSGAMGISLYGNFTVMEGLKLAAQYAYLTNTEDGTTTGDKFESGYTANVSVDYTLAPNTTLAAVYLIADFDSELGFDAERLSVLAARLQVKF
ncbi:MAG: hypothetical protein PVH87_16375 [Desulfobacteraceae bacterium]|jgi:hypothetical protein